MKFVQSLTLLAAFVLLLSGCVAAIPASPTAEPATPATAAMAAEEALFPLTITDAAGQEFTFDAPPKLGCQWIGCIEIMPDLGVPAHASTMNIDDAATTFYAPAGAPAHVIEDWRNPEFWAAAEVDLIVMAAPPSDDSATLTQAAPIFYLHYSDWSDPDLIGHHAFVKNLALLGQLTGQTEAANAALTRFTTALDRLRSLATPETQTRQVAVLRSRESYELYSPNIAFCTVLAEVGLGQCIGESDFLTELNAEELLALDPDWIVYVTNNDSYQERDDPVWLQLSAVKEGRVYDTTSNRHASGSLRALLHPLQEYVHHTLPDAGIPAPGVYLDFDPTQSPLVQPITTAAADTLFPLTITDALGQAFTFDTQPKLGCDWYGCYETMADLGVVLHAAAMKPEMAEQPFYSPVGPPDHLIEDLSNPELWAATEMEVFLSRVPDDPYYDVFREMVPVFFLHHPSYGVSSETGYQAYIANARLLGQLSGRPEAAAAAIAQFETMLANLNALSTPALAAQTVGVLWSDEVYSGLATDNPFCVLLADVGLGRCMGESTGRYVEYNAEEVLALNPDLIIYMLEGGPSHTERTDPVWGELTAVKAGRVYDVIGTRYTCCSMRGLIHSFQEYVSAVLPAAGVPAPGPVETFDPAQSPLVQADFAAAQTQQ